jgi:large subunit ribosomal protein L31e
MAKKQEKKSEITLERTYVVPLRREWLKVPKYKRAAKAVRGLREFLLKHMKGTEVKIGKYLNEAVWSRGMKNPLHKVKVEAKKDEKGIVFAEIEGAPKEEEKKEEKKKPGKEKKEEETKKAKPEAKKEEKKPQATPAASEGEAKAAGKEKEIPKKEEPKPSPKEKSKGSAK